MPGPKEECGQPFVVVQSRFANDPGQMTLPERYQELQTFEVYGPDPAFAKGVTFGDRTGDLSTRKPELLSIASTCAEKIASRS